MIKLTRPLQQLKIICYFFLVRHKIISLTFKKVPHFYFTLTKFSVATTIRHFFNKTISQNSSSVLGFGPQEAMNDFGK